jgi:hypothetical protein
VTAGTIHAADSVASQAESDLAIAYTNATGRSSTATVSADLAGRTLRPGVYTSSSSLGLSGDLTLDAQGDPNAVFVFQAGSTLTVGSGSHVLLIGAAQACNVFWQVGSSATVGSSSAFAGNILALTSISLTTGATLSGRALARNGAVALDTNAITRASCATQTPPSASDISAATAVGQPITVALHGSDATGAPLTYAITSGPSQGTLGPIDQGAGTVAYTPSGAYTGPDSFTYHVSSSSGTSNNTTATVTITAAGASGTTTATGSTTSATGSGGVGATGTPGATGATGTTAGADTTHATSTLGDTAGSAATTASGLAATTGAGGATGATGHSDTATSSTTLPFTGISVLWLLLGGLTLLASGVALRRFSSRDHES